MDVDDWIGGSRISISMYARNDRCNRIVITEKQPLKHSGRLCDNINYRDGIDLVLQFI